MYDDLPRVVRGFHKCSAIETFCLFSHDVNTWPTVSQNALAAAAVTMFLRRGLGRERTSTAPSLLLLLLLTFPSATNEIQAVCDIMKSNTHIFLIFFRAIWLVSRLCPLHIKASELQHCIPTWQWAKSHMRESYPRASEPTTASVIMLFCFYIKTPMLLLCYGILLNYFFFFFFF